MYQVHYQLADMRGGVMAFWSEHAEYEDAVRAADDLVAMQYRRFSRPSGAVVTDGADDRHPIERRRLYHAYKNL